MGGSTDRRAPTSATCTSRCNQTFRSLFFFLETSYSLLNSLKSVQLARFFEIRTPRIQRAFRTAEVDILTTAVTRQEFDCFSKITGNYYFCDPARFSFSFWKFLRSIAGKPQLLHWLLRLLLLPGTCREDIKSYMFTRYLNTQCFNSQMCRTPMLVVEEPTTLASTGLSIKEFLNFNFSLFDQTLDC